MPTQTPLRALFERIQAGLPQRDEPLTQTRVAAECGVSQAFLSQLLSGHKAPSLDVAMRLAAVLSRYAGRTLSVEELFGGEPVRPPLRGRLRSLLRYLMGSGRGR